MQGFINWMELNLVPKMNKINSNAWVQSLKDAMMQVLPLILVGSLLTIMAILQDFIPNFPDMWVVYNYTMGIIGILVAFLIPFNYMERKRKHKMRLIAGMTSFSMYAIIIHLDNAELFDFGSLGAGGMFAAIVVGIISGLVFALFSDFSFFKEESTVPDFVRQWFDNMLPVAILILSTWALVYLLGLDLFTLINTALSPLTKFADNIVGFTLIYFLICFLYSMGISTWMLYSITTPIFLAGITANLALVQAGEAAVHVATNEVYYSGWLAIGGSGGTLFLCLMFLFMAKSQRLRAIGKASILPSILNINEPIVFGAVAWNPILMIPLCLHGLITPIITWIWLNAGLASIPYEVFGFWYCPFPISTWLVSKSVGGLLLLLVLAAVNIVIYFPFFKIYDNMQAKAEKNAETA
ncbi:MAG: PTS transporter subunit EIIC [Clostridiales bacterium]|jgi:PTS system cellobiose-specific IIC component|nr:PTS transporter subunit EIIC [Clostridiales bacterium]